MLRAILLFCLVLVGMGSATEPAAEATEIATRESLAQGSKAQVGSAIVLAADVAIEEAKAEGESDSQVAAATKQVTQEIT